MFDSHDPGDVTGLETLFESRHFGRTAGAAGAGLAAAMRSNGLEETILAMEFGGARGLTVRGVSESGGRDHTPRNDALMTLPEPTTLPPGPDPPTASAGGAASGNGEPPVPSAPSPKRGSNSYRMIAAASCVAALVVAGVTSQAGEKRAPTVSALGGHGASGHSASRDGNGPRLGTPTSVAPTSASPPPSGSASSGAGHGLSVSLASSASDPRGAPGGHVSVSGAATDNGTPSSSSSSPGPGGSAPSPPGSGGSPGTPAGTLVASTLNSVATSVSTVSGQLGSSVSGAGPVTNALGATVSGVSQAVGSTTS